MLHEKHIQNKIKEKNTHFNGFKIAFSLNVYIQNLSQTLVSNSENEIREKKKSLEVINVHALNLLSLLKLSHLDWFVRDIYIYSHLDPSPYNFLISGSKY